MLLCAEYSKFMSCGQCSFGFCIFGTSERLIKYAKKEGLNGPIYGLGGIGWWMKWLRRRLCGEFQEI